MLVYSTILIMIVLLYPISKRKLTISHRRSLSLDNAYIGFVSFVLILLLGLRSLEVGKDTIIYYQMFNNIKGLDITQVLNAQVEHGYRVLQFIVSKLFNEFQFLQIIVAITYVGVVSYYIKKFSKNKMLSYLFFIIFGFYSFAMSATRQTIAIAIIMIAYKFVIEKKLIKFIIAVLVASTFHVTALIFLPSYWVTKFRINKINLFIVTIFALLFYGFRNHIIGILNNYSRITYTSLETGGDKLYLFIIISIIIGLFYKKSIIKKNPDNQYFLYMMIVTAVIMPITQFHPAVLRLNWYFYIFMIIYVPNLLYVIEDRMIKNIGISLYVLVGIYLFFTQTIYETNLVHYTFFWQ